MDDETKALIRDVIVSLDQYSDGESTLGNIGWQLERIADALEKALKRAEPDKFYGVF